MSNYEEDPERKQENSFKALEERIASLKFYVNVFLEEPKKFSHKTVEELVKGIEEAESECKTNCESYANYLKENVDMSRRKTSNQG
jgi:nickel-dependent lactate racemase